jgi:hypothetical protein
MSRVIPSQIVGLIDQVISGWSVGPPPALHEPQAPKISAIIDLASELPNELMVLSGDEYPAYLVGMNALKDLLDFWRSGQQHRAVVSHRAAYGAQSLRTVRDLLVKCPDEIPSPGTTELLFIADVDLRDSIRNDISAANRALVDGLWKATTVLAGAVAEALLLWAITYKKSAPDIENARAAVIPSASKDPNGWILGGYIKVARALGLIEDETAKQADLAREFRNLIHPGRSARLAKKCDRGTALSALAAVELIVRDQS